LTATDTTIQELELWLFITASIALCCVRDGGGVSRRLSAAIATRGADIPDGDSRRGVGSPSIRWIGTNTRNEKRRG